MKKLVDQKKNRGSHVCLRDHIEKYKHKKRPTTTRSDGGHEITTVCGQDRTPWRARQLPEMDFLESSSSVRRDRLGYPETNERRIKNKIWGGECPVKKKLSRGNPSLTQTTPRLATEEEDNQEDAPRHSWRISVTYRDLVLSYGAVWPQFQFKE